MPLITRPKVISTSFLVILCLSVSSCETAQKLGSYFPVSDSATRCEGWICWGDEEPKQTRSSAPRRSVAGSPSSSQSTGGAPRYTPPPSAPSAYVPSGQPGSARQGQAANRAPPAPSLYTPPTGAPPNYPSQNAYQQAAPTQNTKRPDGFPEWAVVPAGLAGDKVTREKDESEQGGDLHPWEANPEWKKDLPASPIDALKESLEW